MANSLSSILMQASSSVLAQQGSRISGWVWVVIFIIVALIVWWLLTRATTEEPDIHVEHGEHHETEEAESADVHRVEVAKELVEETPVEHAPVVPSVPIEPSIPDDLTVLEGIGPKVKSVLNSAGITTFVQLAEADLGYLNKILDGAGYAYMDPVTWPEQAQLLAEGRMEEFEKLTANLKGGRRVS